MSSHKALLEIGIEEIPASEVKSIVSQINGRLPNLLEQQRINYSNIKTFIASRRFGVLIKGLPVARALTSANDSTVSSMSSAFLATDLLVMIWLNTDR